ncbi:MAG TPA: phosphate acyltransferase, partial [Sphingomicrobium sp.]|nr:phosphate acyltransferase [Sphingomicrobium sp.]
MAVTPRIAIDAMGGDIGPAVIVGGMSRARRANRSLRFELYGDAKAIEPELARYKGLAQAVTVHHTTESIAATEKPSQAIRRAKGTSMGMAINAVK